MLCYAHFVATLGGSEAALWLCPQGSWEERTQHVCCCYGCQCQPRENKRVCRSYSSSCSLPASPLMACLPWVQRTVCTVRYTSARHQAFLFVIFQPASGISCIGKEVLVIKEIFSIWKLPVICLLCMYYPFFSKPNSRMFFAYSSMKYLIKTMPFPCW